jgi:hypothetical protein
MHLKLLENQEQAKDETSRREIVKIRAEINEIETREQQQQQQKTYKESTKQKAGSLKKTKKIDKPLANLTQMREKTQISKIRNEKSGYNKGT